MTFGDFLMVASGLAALGLVGVSLLRSRQSVAKWAFIAGMLLLIGETTLALTGRSAGDAVRAARLFTDALLFGALAPGVWLLFSLVYARGNFREFLLRWRLVVGAVFLLLGGIALALALAPLRVIPDGEGTARLVAPSIRWLGGVQVLATLLALMNIEKTLRESIGTMRWRIKFLLLGLFVILGSQIYVQTELLIFPTLDPEIFAVGAGGLLIGSVLMTVTFVRMGRDDVHFYPSRAVLSGSISVVLVGCYLLFVGVLAQVATVIGGAENFEFQAFIVMVALAGLGVFLLSARYRQAVRIWIGRHFARPRHDFRNLWRLFTERISHVRDEDGVAMETVKLACETLETLSATVWLVDERGERVCCAATSSELQRKIPDESLATVPSMAIDAACARERPFNLEQAEGEWAEVLRDLCVKQFNLCGDRICVPVSVGERNLGLLVLGDRAGALPFTVEEFDFLKCVADHAAVAILNFRLANELTTAKQLEAFQAMSTFFIHDLKNATHGLNLTMTNLPDHFDDPEFRADALKSISRISERINLLVERLNVLRNKLELSFTEMDLGILVEKALSEIERGGGMSLERDLRATSKVLVDPDQFREVLTNLVFNARDALGGSGSIRVETGQVGNRAVLTVADNGCGMSSEFVRSSLFKPFRTTKKSGMGIGLFHTKVLVEAHRGTIQVDSEVGRGTTFKVSLPLANGSHHS